MSDKSVMIIVSVIIIFLGAHGHAASANMQKVFEHTIVLSTGMPESMAHFPEIAGIYAEAFKYFQALPWGRITSPVI
jgi:hypothetical protein